MKFIEVNKLLEIPDNDIPYNPKKVERISVNLDSINYYFASNKKRIVLRLGMGTVLLYETFDDLTNRLKALGFPQLIEVRKLPDGGLGELEDWVPAYLNIKCIDYFYRQTANRITLRLYNGSMDIYEDHRDFVRDLTGLGLVTISELPKEEKYKIPLFYKQQKMKPRRNKKGSLEEGYTLDE